jgi:putative ABC transport system substrate-binding protein
VEFLKRFFLFFAIIFIINLSAGLAGASDVIIICDIRLKPMDDMVKVIRESLSSEAAVYLPKDVKGTLNSVVRKENAKIVVTLGGEPTNEALSLPESVPVIYGLLIKPVITKRHNITGVYMTTPVSEYVSLLDRYFPNIKKLGIVLEPETRDVLLQEVSSTSITLYGASNSYEFIKGVNHLDGNIDALILLPDKALLTATAMEQLYRHSFSERVPVLGVSEKHVKMGSLFALVFDESVMGKQIGEMAQKVLSSGSTSGIAPAPPRRFNLYLNSETAKAMKISIPAELSKKARVIYP